MAVEAIRPRELQVHTLAEGSIPPGGAVEVIQMPLEIIGGGEFLVTVEFGKITDTSAPAFLNPSNRLFAIPQNGPNAWGVERSILETIGPDPFIAAGDKIRRAQAGEPINLPGFYATVPFSGSERFRSGRLNKDVIFTNVWGGNPRDPFTKWVAQILTGALGVADRDGISSLAMPEEVLGIRYVSTNDVMMGMLLGIDNTIQQEWYRGNMRGVSLVMDADPLQDNVDAVAERLETVVRRFSSLTGSMQ